MAQQSDTRRDLAVEVVRRYAEEFAARVDVESPDAKARLEKEVAEINAEITHDQRADNHDSLRLNRAALDLTQIVLVSFLGSDDPKAKATYESALSMAGGLAASPMQLDDVYDDESRESYQVGDKQSRAFQSILNDMESPEIWRVSRGDDAEWSGHMEKVVDDVRFIVSTDVGQHDEGLEELQYTLSVVKSSSGVADLYRDDADVLAPVKTVSSMGEIETLIDDFATYTGTVIPEATERKMIVLGLADGSEYFTPEGLSNPDADRGAALTKSVGEAAMYNTEREYMAVVGAMDRGFEPSDLDGTGMGLLEAKYGIINTFTVALKIEPVPIVAPVIEPETPMIAQRNQASSGMGM